jgi:hypothetical protein
MSRLLRLAVRLYPRMWRVRYLEEFEALLAQMSPGPRTVMDVALGGLMMQFRMKQTAIVTSAVLGVVGLATACTVARLTSRRVESSGTMIVTHPAGSLGNENAAVQSHASVLRLLTRSLNNQKLDAIVDSADVRTSGYRDRATGFSVSRRSVDRASDASRGDVRIQVLSPSVIEVSFASNDGAKAARVTHDLMALLSESPDFVSGTTLQILDAPGEPHAAVSARRVTLAGFGGLGAGLLLGVVLSVTRRRWSGK